jgi:hypothetical protein
MYERAVRAGIEDEFVSFWNWSVGKVGVRSVSNEHSQFLAEKWIWGELCILEAFIIKTR